MKKNSIIARLEELERKSVLSFPVVNAEHQSGDGKFYGLPPMEQ